MSGYVFGDRVVDDGGAEFQRILQERGREGIVYTDRDVVDPGDIANGFDIHDLEGWISGGFDPDQFGAGVDGFTDQIQIGHVDKSALDPHRAVDADELAVRTSIEIIAAEHFVAGLQEFEDGIHGGEAAAEADAVAAAFEGGEAGLEGVAGRILRAGVFVAFMLAGGSLHIRGGLEDGGHDGASGGVGGDAGVYRAGAEAVIFVLIHDANVIDRNLLSESRIERI